MDNTHSIHTTPAKHDFSLHTIWLFIPAIIFVIVLTLLVKGLPRRTAVVDQIPVLGEEYHEE